MLIPPPLALYVHLPWCVRKCPYCDFNSHQGKGGLPFDAYVDALLRDPEELVQATADSQALFRELFQELGITPS